MLIHPSLSDVLSSDLWILGCSFWFGDSPEYPRCDPKHLCLVVTLRQPIDRSAVSDSRKGSEQMFICQFSLTNPGSQFPSRSDTTRGMSTQLVVYLLTKFADAAVVGLSKDPPERRASISSSVVSGNQPSNVTDQPHSRGISQQKTTADSRFQSQLVCHKDSTVNLNACFDQVPGFDDCVAVRVLGKVR